MRKSDAASRDVLIQAKEMELAAAFYERELGMRPFLQEPGICGLEAGGFRLFVERGLPYGPVFEVYVDDLEEAKVRLTGLGCAIEAEDASVPKCYVRDPWGLVFNLAQR